MKLKLTLALMALWTVPLTAQEEMPPPASPAVAAETGPIKVGDQASDFELQGIDGTVKLSERFGEDGKPVVLVFSRANW